MSPNVGVVKATGIKPGATALANTKQIEAPIRLQKQESTTKLQGQVAELRGTSSQDRARVADQGLTGRFPLIAEFLQSGFAEHVTAFRSQGQTLGPENGAAILAGLAQLSQGQLEQVRKSLVSQPPHPQMRQLRSAMKGPATVDGIVELLSGKALGLNGATPESTGENNRAIRKINRELGRLARAEVKLLDGREPSGLYTDEQVELKKLRDQVGPLQTRKEQLLDWGRALKDKEGPNWKDKFGMHAAAGLSIGIPGIAGAGFDPLGAVSRADPETGFREANVEKVVRGSFLAGWARHTVGVGNGAGASYGWLYGGGDAIMGKWAGLWIPAVGGAGVARNEETDTSSVCLQVAVPIIPSLGLTPGLYLDLDLFVDHPALTPVVEPVAQAVGFGIKLVKPIFDPVHRGMEKIGKHFSDKGRARRAAERLEAHGGQAPPGKLIEGLKTAD